MAREPASGARPPGRWPRIRREIYRIRYRLLLVNVFIVSVPLVGIGFARQYEREMLRGLEDDMVHQAQLLRATFLADPAGPRLQERGTMLAASARYTRTRIRLLDGTGGMLADSHAHGPPEGRGEHAPDLLGNRVDPPIHEPHVLTAAQIAARPEIQRAMAGHYGSTTRIWKYPGGDRVYLFSALPIIPAAGGVAGIIYVTRSTLPVLAGLYRLRAALLKVLIAAVAATAILSLFLAGTIARPLSRLMRIAGRIAAGDRSQPLALRRHDEIGELARAIDQMARKLDQRAQDVAEMTANISHEFKSPLTSIRGAAELLLDGAAEDPAARSRFLRNILADAERLDRLLSRLLELSRLEAETTPVEMIDYEALVREVGEQQNAIVEYRAAGHYLPARHVHLGSALRALLENAAQHARPQSAITLRVSEPGPGWIRTSVHNDGDPISPANLPRVWDRFFTTRSNQGGTGLGLAIVASVVKRHHGTVSVTSSAEEGTTFSFDLPG
jgi:two-component system, OmpR family, sensor histidine kinase ChvG